MEYAHLGRTGLLVSRIGLGTMNFGVTTDETEAFGVMDRAIELGVNLFDSADHYGGRKSRDVDEGHGTTEEIIGRWLKRSGRRDEIVLATKAYQPMGPGPNDRRLSAYHLKRACEASLRRLQTDHIDLYQMHHVDRATPFEEIWQAMEQLVAEGKITYVGSSNFAGWDIATAQLTAQHRNLLGLVSEQSVYNLTNRAVEQELIPALTHFGIGLIPYSPLGGGLLAGKPKTGERTERRTALGDRYDTSARQLDAYEALCTELGRTPAEVAQAWLLHQPVVSTLIAGARTRRQLEAAVDAFGVGLDAKGAGRARPHLARPRRRAEVLRLVTGSTDVRIGEPTPSPDTTSRGTSSRHQPRVRASAPSQPKVRVGAPSLVPAPKDLGPAIRSPWVEPDADSRAAC